MQGDKPEGQEAKRPDSTPKRVTYHRIECPFDLDAVFTLQYDTKGLKTVLEFILENLGRLDEMTLDLATGLTE